MGGGKEKGLGKVTGKEGREEKRGKDLEKETRVTKSPLLIQKYESARRRQREKKYEGSAET